MAYAKTTWVSGTTAVDAAPLNNLETQHEDILGGQNPYTGTGAGLRDEDDMATDDPLAPATQQSVKAYVGSLGGAIEGTVADFQVNAATGTFSGTDANINDNNTATIAAADAIAQYAEIDYGKVVSVNQFRHFGDVTNNGDGAWKIQYYHLADHAWTDWVTGIATRDTADWSGWDSTGGEIITNKIRWTVVTVDTQGANDITELEVKYA